MVLASVKEGAVLTGPRAARVGVRGDSLLHHACSGSKISLSLGVQTPRRCSCEGLRKAEEGE